jgi:hypothetical protein
MITEMQKVNIKDAGEHLEIWKFFSQRKEELQSRLYSFITWSFGALIAFVTFALEKWDSLCSNFKFWYLFFWAAIIIWGCIVTMISLKMKKHIKRNGDRQINAAELINGLKEIINGITDNLEVKKVAKHKVTEILKLYKNSTISEMLNDLVAIGTWPTQEHPVTVKCDAKTGGGSVAIDTVPLPERTKKMKKIIEELIEVAGDRTIKSLEIKSN